MKKYPFLLLLLLAALLFNCEKLSLSSKKFKAKEFPITLGSYWEYARIDSVNLVVDTVRVTVIEENATYGDEEGLWKIEWKTRQGAFLKLQYVQITKDTVLFRNPKSTTSRDYLSTASAYIFPLEVGDSWNWSDWTGTYTVEDDEVESDSYGKDYGEGFFVSRYSRPQAGQAIYESIVLVEGIGIVWRSLDDTFMRISTSHEIYRLIDYHIE